MLDTHRQDVTDPAASGSRIGFRPHEPGDESNQETGATNTPVVAVGFGWSAKQGPIRRWIGERPLAWLDDQFGGKEEGWAAVAATATASPH